MHEHDEALVLKASTGIGLAIVADGRLVRGHRNAAGQLGHVKVPAADGLRCRCGESGCLETVASGWAFVERLRAAGTTSTTCATWSPPPDAATDAPAPSCASPAATSARRWPRP